VKKAAQKAADAVIDNVTGKDRKNKDCR